MDGGEAAARRMVGCCGNKAILTPIMMRFRPIAPKPVAGGSLSGAASSMDSKSHSAISKGRTKRKYVRVRRYNRKKKPSTRSSNGSTTDGNKNSPSVDPAAVTTTLQLLPERHVELLVKERDNIMGKTENENENENDVVLVSDRKRKAVMELWVTVESVREDACMEQMLELEGREVGCTDEERKKKLDEDTCPGFVSDGMNRVEWLNRAFKRMVRQREERNDSESQVGEVGVRLIWKAKLLGPGGNCNNNNNININRKRVFTCQIKLQYKRGTEMEKDTKLVPCDAWRMNGGGFAWKLDVKAALTLGAPLLQEDFHF